MSDAETPRCATCRFYDESQVYVDGTPDVPGRETSSCRRFPPMSREVRVGPDDWCGEWAARGFVEREPDARPDADAYDEALEEAMTHVRRAAIILAAAGPVEREPDAPVFREGADYFPPTVEPIVANPPQALLDASKAALLKGVHGQQ